MDEEEKKQPAQQPEQSDKPGEKSEQSQQQGSSENQSEETRTQESPPSTPQEEAPMQQPHLVGATQEKKKGISLPSIPSLPHKSFIIAIITIGVTIAAGIAIAVNVGKLTQRGPKTKEEVTTPQIIPRPTLPPKRPTIQESSPSGQEATPSSSFEELLDLEQSEEATPSGPRVATEQAQPTQ